MLTADNTFYYRFLFWSASDQAFVQKSETDSEYAGKDRTSYPLH